MAERQTSTQELQRRKAEATWIFPVSTLTPSKVRQYLELFISHKKEATAKDINESTRQKP